MDREIVDPSPARRRSESCSLTPAPLRGEGRRRVLSPSVGERGEKEKGYAMPLELELEECHILSVGPFTEKEWEVLVRALGLTPRQSQVCAALLRGCGDKQIAREIGISIPTVRTHLNKLFERLGATDRSELLVALFREFRTREGRRLRTGSNMGSTPAHLR